MSRVALVVLLLLLVDAVADAGPPRPLGPAAAAHSRIRRHGRSTWRVTRRTPEVMAEEAARVPRGEIFRTWENAARQ